MRNKKIKILVVGKNSFLAKNYYYLSRLKKKIKIIKYTQIESINYENYTHIVNFSYDPKIYSKNYYSTNRIDKKICNLIKNKDIIYVFPSSRLIYKIKNKFENSKKEKHYYSQNKKIIEDEIKRSRKKKYLILRIVNILEFNLDKRKLFISSLLNTLKNKNYIKYDLSNKSYKDFITLKYFAKSLDSLIELKRCGIFNISSGKKINIHELGKLIIKGYGSGNILYKKKLYNDSFVLNNKKLKETTGLDLTKSEVLKNCIYIGKKLKRVINLKN